MKNFFKKFVSVVLTVLFAFAGTVQCYAQEANVVDMTRKGSGTSDMTYVFYIALAAVMFLFIIGIFVFWSAKPKKHDQEDDISENHDDRTL